MAWEAKVQKIQCNDGFATEVTNMGERNYARHIYPTSEKELTLRKGCVRNQCVGSEYFAELRKRNFMRKHETTVKELKKYSSNRVMLFIWPRC